MELQSLQLKLSKFGELFTKYPNLDKFISTANQSSPKRKKTLTDNTVPQNTQQSINSAITNPLYSEILTQENGTQVTLQENHPPINQYESSVVPLTSSQSQNIPIDPIQEKHYSEVNNPSDVIIHPLIVIPPKKSIFISRFAFETSPSDIEYYIKNKIKFDGNIIVHKFKYSQTRSISSFKIMVPSDIFNIIIDPTFWPENELIREFVIREPRITNTRIPEQITNVQKN